MSDTVSEAFVLIVDLALKQGRRNIKDQVVDVAVDDTWKVRVNGCSVERENIPPFHAYVEFNGWPAGFIGTDGGGVIAAGEAANEDALIAALRAAGAECPE